MGAIEENKLNSTISREILITNNQKPITPIYIDRTKDKYIRTFSGNI